MRIDDVPIDDAAEAPKPKRRGRTWSPKEREAAREDAARRRKQQLPEYGRRVKLSDAGRACSPRRDPDQLGTIVGQSSGGQSWSILWDGTKWPAGWHKDFIELLPPDDDAESQTESQTKRFGVDEQETSP